MCFNIDIKTRNSRPKPEVAKEDIIVWKVIKKNGWGWTRNLVINGVAERWTRGFEYEETTPFADFRVSGVFRLWISFNANCFHSNATYKEAKSKRDDDEKIVKMIIPKGAFYYKSKTEYISNRIIYP